MKEHVEPKTDPILEECYRIKAEFSAQFNSLEELYDYVNYPSLKTWACDRQTEITARRV